MLCESDIKFQQPEHGSGSTFTMSAFMFVVGTAEQQTNGRMVEFSVFKCISEQFVVTHLTYLSNFKLAGHHL